MHLLFDKRIKLEKGKKAELPMKKGVTIQWDESSDFAILTTFSLNFSQFSPGAADLELKMHLQLT